MADHKIAPSAFRFQPHVKNALAYIAEREGRSMANMLEWLIKHHCENQSLGWPPVQTPKTERQSATKAKRAAVTS